MGGCVSKKGVLGLSIVKVFRFFGSAGAVVGVYFGCDAKLKVSIGVLGHEKCKILAGFRGFQA